MGSSNELLKTCKLDPNVAHRRVLYGEIEPDTEYVPHKVEERCVHSDHTLYSSILQQGGLAQDHPFQENDERESLEESSEDDDYLDASLSKPTKYRVDVADSLADLRRIWCLGRAGDGDREKNW